MYYLYTNVLYIKKKNSPVLLFIGLLCTVYHGWPNPQHISPHLLSLDQTHTPSSILIIPVYKGLGKTLPKNTPQSSSAKLCPLFQDFWAVARLLWNLEHDKIVAWLSCSWDGERERRGERLHGGRRNVWEETVRKVFYKMGNLNGGAGTVLENRQSAPLLLWRGMGVNASCQQPVKWCIIFVAVFFFSLSSASFSSCIYLKSLKVTCWSWAVVKLCMLLSLHNFHIGVFFIYIFIFFTFCVVTVTLFLSTDYGL